jgi:hypothetical protein
MGDRSRAKSRAALHPSCSGDSPAARAYVMQPPGRAVPNYVCVCVCEVRVRGRAAPASGRAPGTGERGRRALGGRALTLEGGAFRVCTRCGPSVSDCALNY